MTQKPLRLHGRSRGPFTPGSQNAVILDRLLAGDTLTPLDALQLCGCMRLSERIREIEAHGFTIAHEPVTIGEKRVMSYRHTPGRGKR